MRRYGSDMLAIRYPIKLRLSCRIVIKPFFFFSFFLSFPVYEHVNVSSLEKQRKASNSGAKCFFNN